MPQATVGRIAFLVLAIIFLVLLILAGTAVVLTSG